MSKVFLTNVQHKRLHGCEVTDKFCFEKMWSNTNFVQIKLSSIVLDLNVVHW